jgi:hypothetical protein
VAKAIPAEKTKARMKRYTGLNLLRGRSLLSFRMILPNLVHTYTSAVLSFLRCDANTSAEVSALLFRRRSIPTIAQRAPGSWMT